MTLGELVVAIGAAELLAVLLALPLLVTSGDPLPRLGVESPAAVLKEPEEKVREAA